MTELHSNLYYKHTNIEIMHALDALFLGAVGDEQLFFEQCHTLNPAEGRVLAQALIDAVDDARWDLTAESLGRMAGYSVLHFVHGSTGDDIIGAIITFLYRLAPDIHAQAWGCGDDDPWEFWFKYEDGEVVRKDDEPFLGKVDESFRGSLYSWWHAEMPEEIREGFLNEAA